MKIIHFHPDATMARQFVAPLIEAEQCAGHETQIVHSKIIDSTRNVTAFPFELSIKNLIRLPLTLWRIKSFLDDSRPDIVFSHNSRSSLLPLLAARWSGVPVRIYFNHGVPYVGYKGVFCGLLKIIERWNLILSTRVVTVSQDMVELLKGFRVDVQIDLINEGSACGVELAAWRRDNHEAITWRKEQNLHDQDLIVLFVGRAEKRKGFDFILKLFADKLTDSHIKLVMCGPSRADVHRALGKVPHNVMPLGFVHSVPKVMLNANLVVVPSLHEGLSYAAIEAHASGVLVVGNDIHGLRCVVKNRVNGILVATNDVDEYVQVIRTFDSHRNAFSKLTQQARVDVLRFSRDLFLLYYVQFLGSLVPRKKVWFVATTPFAVNAFLRAHILAMTKRYEVVLCVDNDVYPLTKDLVNNLEVVDVRITRKISFWRDLMALRRLWMQFNDRSPDVVHSITPKAGLLAMLAARMTGVQRRYHTFTGQVWANQFGLRRVMFKKIDHIIVGLASDVFVDSESQRELLYRENLAEPGGIGMLGGGSISGVDLQRFYPDPIGKDKKRQEVGSSPDVCVYLFIGRITRDKGIFDLVEAFRQVAIDVSGVELWVVGPDEENLSRGLKKTTLDCDAPIRWFGPTLRPDEFMVAADVLLLPSYREGFGSVIIEGAACGLPAIAYRIVGVIDAVEEGYSGILTDVGDVAAFAAAMKSIGVNKDLRLRLGRQARGRAEQYFNSEDVTEAWLDWYRKALD